MSVRTLGDVVSRSGRCPSVLEGSSVFDLAQALCQGRVDAVAVLSGSQILVGIATSQDVAKCVARGEDLHKTKVAQIMTPHPVTLPPTETPANALSLMREGRFRHIPIVANDNVTVLGIVDVLNLAYDAITRLQVSYDMIPSRRGFEFMRAARDTIEKPTLAPIVSRSSLATLSGGHSVTDACEALVRERLAAIVIVNEDGELDGIFTCRDVVSRVVVSQLSPTETLLSQVMTRNPDCGHPDFTILESLQRMQACGYRHLPVVDEHSRLVVGLVDILQLASDSILGLQNLKDDQSPRVSRTVSFARPGVARGFASFFSSLFSSSYAESDVVPEQPIRNMRMNPSPVKSTSPLRYSNRRSTKLPSARRQLSFLGSDLASTVSKRNSANMPSDMKLASFKFRDINKEWRRIKAPLEVENGSFDQFLLDVRRRYAGSCSVGSIKIKYVDEDEDEVLLGNDEDLLSCLEDYVESRKKTISLKVYSSDVPSTSQLQSPVSSAPSSALGSPRQMMSREREEFIPFQSRATTAPIKSQEEPKPLGITRTLSRPLNLTPSQIKTAEGHQKMLDGEREAAIAFFEQALQIDPKNARAMGGRGAARLFNGNSVGAEEDYRAAIVMIEAGKYGEVGDLTFQSSIVGLVESLIDQRRYEEGLTVANRIELSTGNTGCADAFRDELDAAGNAAREALETSEFGDAIACYTNALRVETVYLKLMPKEMPRSSLRLGRAKCYKALQDFDMALEDYEEAIKLEPESVAGHKGCGKCFAELEQMDRALEAYERAHKLDLADDEVRHEIELIKKSNPDRLAVKKAEIAKLGALLGGLKLNSRNA